MRNQSSYYEILFVPTFIMKGISSYNIRKMIENSFIQNLPSKINVLESFEHRNTYTSYIHVCTDVKFTLIFMTYVII
jgi:hypothetical protein